MTINTCVSEHQYVLNQTCFIVLQYFVRYEPIVCFKIIHIHIHIHYASSYYLWSMVFCVVCVYSKWQDAKKILAFVYLLGLCYAIKQ